MIFLSRRNKSNATDPSKFVIKNDSFLFNIRFQNIRLQNGVRSAQRALGKSRNLDFICYIWKCENFLSLDMKKKSAIWIKLGIKKYIFCTF